MGNAIATRARKSQAASEPRRRLRLRGLLPAGTLLFAAAAALGATERARAAPPQKVRAESYKIEISLQPEKGSLSAKTALTLEARQPVAAIELELNPRLKIKEITDALGRKLAFDRSPRIGSPKFLVRLAELCRPGQRITLTFLYEGAPLLGGLDYIHKDGILLRDESRWYPAVDLSAFTQNDFTIELPPGWDALTSGERSGTGPARRWKTEAPVSSRSLVAYPTGPQYRCEAQSVLNGEPKLHDIVSSCFSSEPRASWSRLEGRIGSLLHWYGKWFGPFPSRKLTFVRAFPGAPGAIGYSAPGLLVISEDVVKFADDPNYMPEFLPHEVAHQWFPIQVTLENEQDGWLAESLAEYLAWRYLQEKSPAQARALVARALRDAPAVQPPLPLQEGLRLFALPDWERTYATLYQRGMLVFRTLETVIDRERLDRALREYYRRFAGRSASIADFRRICEEVSGRDLGWFFDYFLKGTEIPEIELRRVPSPVPGEVAGEIVVRNVPPDFSVRVEMRIDTLQGPVDHSVATRGEATPFAVAVPGSATRITLEPNARILRWTEAARRNRAQRELLAELRKRETERDYAAALTRCQQALDADPDDLAANQQHIRFACGRLHYRLGQPAQAVQQFERVLALASLDRETTDFFLAWARVYRAQIEQERGNLTAARAEAQAGLEIRSAALETEVTWPETPDKRTNARDELERLAR